MSNTTKSSMRERPRNRNPNTNNNTTKTTNPSVPAPDLAPAYIFSLEISELSLPVCITGSSPRPLPLVAAETPTTSIFDGFTPEFEPDVPVEASDLDVVLLLDMFSLEACELFKEGLEPCLCVMTMGTKTSREGLKNKIQLTCKYKRNKHKLANPLGEMPIGQKPRAGLNITGTPESRKLPNAFWQNSLRFEQKTRHVFSFKYSRYTTRNYTILGLELGCRPHLFCQHISDIMLTMQEIKP